MRKYIFAGNSIEIVINVFLSQNGRNPLPILKDLGWKEKALWNCDPIHNISCCEHDEQEMQRSDMDMI